jgi:hypothetical protein
MRSKPTLFSTSQVVFCLNDLDVSIHAVIDASLTGDKVGLDWNARRGSGLGVSYTLESGRLIVAVAKKSRQLVTAHPKKGLRLPTVGVEGDQHTLRIPENTPLIPIRETRALRYAGANAPELRLHIRFADCKYAIIP